MPIGFWLLLLSVRIFLISIDRGGNLLLLHLERCIAVYSPFLAKRFCTTHSARRSIFLFLTISTIFFGISFPLLYQIKGVTSKDKCRIRQQASTFIRIYQSILFIGIPDILLLSNVFTIYTLIRRRQRLSLSNMNKGEQLQMRVNDVQCSRKQRQLTIMLVTVSLSFYLFTTPAMVVFIKEMRPSGHRNLEKYKRDFLFSQITVVVSELNNAVSSFSIEFLRFTFSFLFRLIFSSIVLLVNVFDMQHNDSFVNTTDNGDYSIIDIFSAIESIIYRRISNTV